MTNEGNKYNSRIQQETCERLKKVVLNKEIVHFMLNKKFPYKAPCGEGGFDEPFTPSFLFVTCPKCREYTTEKSTGLKVDNGILRRNKKNSKERKT